MINDDGLLVSAVAASDLKALLCEASSVCSLSTVEFLTKVGPLSASCSHLGFEHSPSVLPRLHTHDETVSLSTRHLAYLTVNPDSCGASNHSCRSGRFDRMALALIKWLFGEICTCSSYIHSSSIAFVRTRSERLCSICTVKKKMFITVHSLRNSHICPDRSTDTLAHVITKLASTKAHRVYVVENGKATSVISLTDLLRHIYTNPDFADW